VSDDIFDGPLPGHSTLIHTRLANLGEQGFPLFLLSLEVGKQFGLGHQLLLVMNRPTS
jgi:hypothetical protein